MYLLPNIIWVIKLSRIGWAGCVACMGVKRNANRVLMGKAEGKRLLVRTMHRWEGNINMFLSWDGRV